MSERQSTQSMVGTASINNGPSLPCQLVIEREILRVDSISPKPDPWWSAVDSAGHFHAYDQSPDAERAGHYPTLQTRVEEIECTDPDHWDPDSPCTSLNIIHWHCRICGEEIAPGVLVGPHTDHIDGRYDWQAKVGVPFEGAMGLIGQEVSVRAEVGDWWIFGAMVATDVHEIRSDSDRATVHFRANGPMGRQKISRRAAA